MVVTRGVVSVSPGAVDAGDSDLLRAGCHGLDMRFPNGYAAHMDLFLENKAPLDDEHLLDHGDDGRVAVHAHRRDRFDNAVNRNMLDLNPFVNEIFFDDLFTDAGRDGSADAARFDTSTADGEPFGEKRQHLLVLRVRLLAAGAVTALRFGSRHDSLPSAIPASRWCE
jgi:hypothetical protein